MSLYGSMNTALSGMNAQSRALGHISDNVANSQTIGFKRTDTNFVSYISESSLDIHRPGTVLARPDFTNQVQGTIEQVENPLAMAVSGQGFFTAAMPMNKNGDGSLEFDPRTFYTRAGDFNRDSGGYLVNGAGYALQGWPVNDGQVNKAQLAPIRVLEDVYTPSPSTTLDFVGNLASGGTAEQSTAIQIIDSLGNSRVVTLTFAPTATPTTPNTWTLSINAADATNGTPAGNLGAVTVQFGKDPTDAAFDQADGTLAKFVTATATIGTITIPTDANMAKDKAAQLTFKADFGQGVQTLTLDLGKFGVAGGLTQFAKTGTSGLSVSSFSQDGIPLGSFSSVTTQKNGDVQINYDNGQSRVVARVPITTFKDPDKLEHLDGQAFLRTPESGEARIMGAGEDGAGLLTIRAVERSNVDIATEFSKLILAQRAYSANTRLVTTVDELMQETLNMRR
jgi:flagellar hook protein FlgE